MQPGDPLPDCTPEADRKCVETPCSWLVSIARTGHEYAAVLRDEIIRLRTEADKK